MTLIHRLRKNKEFQLVFKRGRSYANRHLVLYCLPQEASAEFRVGFSVSKKIGNAVIRNQVKRFLKESLRTEKDHLIVGFDVVLIARSGIEDLDFFEVRKQLIQLLRKASCINKNE